MLHPLVTFKGISSLPSLVFFPVWVSMLIAFRAIYEGILSFRGAVLITEVWPLELARGLVGAGMRCL